MNLEVGITFKVKDNGTETFSRYADGVVAGIFRASDGYESRVLLAQGVYLLEYTDLENGQPDQSTGTTYAFPVAPTKMPPPQPLGAWNGEVGTREGDEFGKEIQSYQFGALTEISYGACTYGLITVQVHYDDEDETMDLLHYLPELGLSYLAGSDYGPEDDRKSDRYTYYEVSVASGASAPKKGGLGRK